MDDDDRMRYNDNFGLGVNRKYQITNLWGYIYGDDQDR